MKIKLSLVVVATFVLIGCGGSGSSGAVAQSQNASDILEGKTLYYTDNMLDDPEGYFSNAFFILRRVSLIIFSNLSLLFSFFIK